MKNLSLKLADNVFKDAETILTKIKKPRNRYINDAVNFYNKYHQQKILKNLLHKESIMVAKSSMEILHELEQLED